MRTTILLAVLLTCCACSTGTSELDERCVDGWLSARGLDEYGHPTGTVYSGGSPLRDEHSGRVRTRAEYLLERHPALGESCLKP